MWGYGFGSHGGRYINNIEEMVKAVDGHPALDHFYNALAVMTERWSLYKEYTNAKGYTEEVFVLVIGQDRVIVDHWGDILEDRAKIFAAHTTVHYGKYCSHPTVETKALFTSVYKVCKVCGKEVK